MRLLLFPSFLFQGLPSSNIVAAVGNADAGRGIFVLGDSWASLSGGYLRVISAVLRLPALSGMMSKHALLLLLNGSGETAVKFMQKASEFQHIWLSPR